MTTPPEILTWAVEVASTFRREERHLATRFATDWDAALVEYVLRVLATAHDPITRTVLETIDRRRAVTV